MAMNSNSPYEFRRQLENRYRTEIEVIKRKKDKKMSKIRNHLKYTPKKRPSEVIDMILKGGCIAYVILVIVLISLGIWDFISYLVAFIGVLLMSVLLYFCGVGLDNYNNKIANNRIYKEEEQYNKKITALNVKKTQEYTKYLEIYEADIKRDSVKYLNSDMLQRVVNRAYDAISAEIRCADKRMHIETILVHFPITVYYNKIGLGKNNEFDFVIECCNPLYTYDELASIANATSSELRTRLIQNDEFANGMTSFKLNYLQDSVIAEFEYEEKNSNYIPSSSF